MNSKYCIFIIYIICVAKICAFEFQNLQLVDYDEKSTSILGTIDLNQFQKIGNKYYRIDRATKMSWWDAYFECRKHKSFLASITSLNELDTLASHLSTLDIEAKYWVGANDLHVEGSLRWMDSGELIPRGNLWIAGEPNDRTRSENCVNLFADGAKKFRLNDAPCDYVSQFICERETPKAVAFVAW